MDRLFPGEITDIPGFVKRSSRLKNALGPHVCALLSKGISVVLDFPADTKAQRAWFRELFEGANAEHELHFVDASDALCKGQLKERSKNYLQALPGPRMWSSTPSLGIFSLHQMMKGSMSSVMSASNLCMSNSKIRLHSCAARDPAKDLPARDLAVLFLHVPATDAGR